MMWFEIILALIVGVLGVVTLVDVAVNATHWIGQRRRARRRRLSRLALPRNRVVRLGGRR